MGLSYRKKLGPVRLSVSRRGPRASIGGGCLLPLIIAGLAATAATRAMRGHR